MGGGLGVGDGLGVGSGVGIGNGVGVVIRRERDRVSKLQNLKHLNYSLKDNNLKTDNLKYRYM